MRGTRASKGKVYSGPEKGHFSLGDGKKGGKVG